MAADPAAALFDPADVPAGELAVPEAAPVALGLLAAGVADDAAPTDEHADRPTATASAAVAANADVAREISMPPSCRTSESTRVVPTRDDPVTVRRQSETQTQQNPSPWGSRPGNRRSLLAVISPHSAIVQILNVAICRFP